MPHVTIEVLKGRSAAEKKAIMQAVFDSLVEVLKSSPENCHIKINELEPENFFKPTDKFPNHFTIQIQLFAGRPFELRRQLYASIVKHLTQENIESQHAVIFLQEIPKENWGMKGGVPASEIK
jgi:phenylpyruvate tautomerase PptA (4-oxalocrotonate tautomerase family)